MKTAGKRYEKRATTFIVTLCFLLFNGGVEGICIYPLETIELILPVLVDEYLFCISSKDAFQGFGKVCASKGYEKGSRAPLFLCVPKRHGYSSSGNAFSLFQSVFPQLRVES